MVNAVRNDDEDQDVEFCLQQMRDRLNDIMVDMVMLEAAVRRSKDQVHEFDVQTRKASSEAANSC